MTKKFESLLSNDPISIDGWELLGRIGQGGFGTIYIGRKANITAAIKMISRESINDDESWQRFGNEVRNLKKLNHPNVARVIEENLRTANPYIAIEFFDGQTLESLVKESGPLSKDVWFKYFKSLLSALEHCHSNGIIHKDLSPSNIVISNNEPKLIDFGNSFLRGSERLTQQGVVTGTPGFMSPEHYEGNDLSQEMDLFSLASVFTFAGTGHIPFNGKTKVEYSNKTKYEPPDLNGLSSSQLDILTPLFYKNPKNRPEIAEIFLAIDEILKNQELSSYEKYLKHSDKKLRSLPVNSNLQKRQIKKLAFFVMLAIVLTVGVISLFQNNNGTTSRFLTLSDSQLQNLSVCKDKVLLDESEAAIISCRELAELGNSWAQYGLGTGLQKQGNIAEGELWLTKAAKQNLPEALIALTYQEIEKKNYSQALIWAKQSADLGELDGINAVGISYGYLGQYDLAVEWYKKSWELGDVLGAINLGFHYRFDDYDKNEAAKWLKIAAENSSELFEGDTAFEYAEFLRIDMRNTLESCKWYKKSSDLAYKEGNKDGIEAYKKFCTIKKTALNPVQSALLSSDELKVSPPLSSAVSISQIFGRVFKDSEMIWRIILTNSNIEPVPPINGIQFRLAGYEDAGWVSLPYKLKKDSGSNSVYAAVDDLFLAVLFKKPVCPEFRAVREENGKLVNIWTKGKPECSNDFIP